MVIYKVENIINNKIYIGYTCNFHKRKLQHENETKKGSSLHFHRALRKCGLNSFIWTIIDECKKEDVKQKEIYWIEFYNSFKNGYNMTIGGDGALGHKLKNKRSLSWQIKQSRSHIKNTNVIKSRLLSNNESIYTMEQRIIHSKVQLGELNSSSKLSKKDVFNIYRFWDSGNYTLTQLALLFPVDRRHLGRIVKGITRICDFKEYYAENRNKM